MKKWMSAFVAGMMLFSTVSVCAESVATSQYNEEKSDDVDQYFTTEGKIDNNVNGFVTIVVTDGDAVTVDSIMYIDQTIAEQDGSFAFADYIPKENLKVGEKYTVRIGATALAAPISGGYLELPDAKKYTVSGSLSFMGGKRKAYVQILNADGSVQAEAETETGDFVISNVPDGTYKVYITKQSHLPAQTEMTVSGEDVQLEPVRLLAGDINEDKIINIFDLTNLIEMFGKSETSAGFREEPDLDENGTVNIFDLTALIENFGKGFQE